MNGQNGYEFRAAFADNEDKYEQRTSLFTPPKNKGNFSQGFWQFL